MTPGDSVQCDVLVVGGGVSGIAAAVGASRAGAKVALIEKYGFLGGMATAGMVSTVCGAYLHSAEGKARFVSQGFVKECIQALADRSGAEPLALPGGLLSHIGGHESFQQKMVPRHLGLAAKGKPY